MADIINEVESLRDFVADPASYSRIWMQHLPDKYTPGELSIRYVGDTTTSETAYHYRLDREYQFVYFSTSELDCIRKTSALQRKINSSHAIKLKGSERYIRNGVFSVSQPFKTEGSEVFAIIGVMQAEVREARDFSASEVPKMGGVSIKVEPKSPSDLPYETQPEADSNRGIPGINDGTETVVPSNKYPEKEYELKTGNGACN